MSEYYGTSAASSDFLAHYGVKGMKWGVRRAQKADGSLTDKGKKMVAQSGLYLDINYHGKGRKYTKRNRSDVISENHNYREYHHDEMYDRPHVSSKASKDYDDYIKDKYASATLKDLGLKDTKRGRNSVKGLYKDIDPDYRWNYYPSNSKRMQYEKRRKDVLHPTRAKMRKSLSKLGSGINMASSVKNLLR